MVSSNNRHVITPADRAKANDPAVYEELRERILAPLSPKRRRMVEDRLAQVPKSQRRTYLRAIEGKSPMAAINAGCAECMCWERKEVTNCTEENCSHYSLRPFQKDSVGQEEETAPGSGEPE